MDRKIITVPVTGDNIDEVRGLKAGEMVCISGKIYTGRDAAHKRMVEMINEGKGMPFDFENQVIFYAGPCPEKPGRIIGSIGPTTSVRMDAYTPALIKKGLKYMIGKGDRGEEVINAVKEHGGVYFVAIGGAAALMSKCVKSARVVAFDDLGTEAIRELVVSELPVIVAVGSGNL